MTNINPKDKFLKAAANVAMKNTASFNDRISCRCLIGFDGPVPQRSLKKPEKK